MVDKIFDLGDGTKVKFKDMGDGTHAEVISVAGGGGAQAVISGVYKVGQTLTATPAAGYSFTAGVWKRDGVAISGATGLTYVQVTADIGHVLSFTPTSPVYAAPGGTTAADVPGAPTIGIATAGNGTITLNATAPASDGGSAIIGYRGTLNDGTVKTSATLPVIFTGMPNGVARAGVVQALNGIGYGPASAPSNSVTPVAGATNLLVVFGQSQVNCNGTMFNGVYDVPTNLQPAMTDVGIWNRYTPGFETYQAGVNSVPALNGGTPSGQPNYYGPEAEYARRWKRDNPGVPMFIVKLGASSSSLSSVTAGANGYWDPAASANLYSQLKTDVLNAIAVLNAQGYTVNVTALFVQGENDTSNALAYNAYATNLRALIAACRTDWLGANGPFVIARVKDAGSAPTGFAAVRAAQQLVGETDTACRWFDLDVMQLGGDGFHFGPAGTQEMGQRAYDTCMKASDVVAKYVAQMTTPASAPDQALMVTMLDYIIRRGAWATVAYMNLYTQDTQQAALLNLKPGVAQTSVNGGMTFTPRIGFTGTGITSKVDTGVVMANGGDTLIKASNFAISWYSRDNVGGVADVGVNGSGGTGGILGYATPSSVAATNRYRILSDTPATDIPSPATANGFWTLDRTSSLLAPVFYKGTKLGTETGAVGTVLPTLPIWVGNRNNNNNSGGTKSYQVFMAGRSRTDYQEAAIATAVEAYIAAMGAN